MMNESTRTAAANTGPAQPAEGAGTAGAPERGTGAGTTEPPGPEGASQEAGAGTTQPPGPEGAGQEAGAITGEPRVDEALAPLADLHDAPGTAHVEAFEAVYRRLHGLLDELDTRPGGHEVPDDQAEQA